MTRAWIHQLWLKLEKTSAKCAICNAEDAQNTKILPIHFVFTLKENSFTISICEKLSFNFVLILPQKRSRTRYPKEIANKSVRHIHPHWGSAVLLGWFDEIFINQVLNTPWSVLFTKESEPTFKNLSLLLPTENLEAFEHDK